MSYTASLLRLFSTDNADLFQVEQKTRLSR